MGKRRTREQIKQLRRQADRDLAKGLTVSDFCRNGSEFIGEALQSWLPSRGTESVLVTPGSPWENGFIESFNSRFREEFLEVEEFESACDAKEKGGWFRREYNTVRPHSSLDYKTALQFSTACDLGQHGQPPNNEKSI